jgi:diguanylate cyclase (GGDEF)-like protein
LPNRALLRDRIQQALTRAGHHQEKIGLIFLDLDNFKKIDDTLGHQVGDELLRLVANRLRTAIREDNTVARLGGDEFVMLLEGITGEDDATIVANDIKEALTEPLNLAGRDFSITTSIGIAIADGVAASKDQGLDEIADNLLRDADIAMYRAKANGKARHVIFDSSMQREILDQLELESDLEKAIANDELVLHYQPIVSFNNGQIEEVEALVRWRHPTRGLISPAEFIPTAESTGLIVPIGRWVLEEACRQAVAWDSQFPTKPPLIVSVNLSARQFPTAQFGHRHRADIAQNALPGCPPQTRDHRERGHGRRRRDNANSV